MSDPKVEMRTIVEATPERVFRAWTDPQELQRWWGPGAFTTPHAEVDLRPGGRYELVMQLPGAEPMRLAGTFREVEPPSRLVYTWRWESGNPDTTESVVEVEFHDLGGKRTEIVLVHEGFGEGAPIDMYSVGWQGGFEKLAALVRAAPSP